MNEEDRHSHHLEANKIAEEAWNKKQAVPVQTPVPAFPPAPAPSWARGQRVPDTKQIQAQKVADETRQKEFAKIDKEAKEKIERDVIDKLPPNATEHDKQLIRDQAHHRLEHGVDVRPIDVADRNRQNAEPNVRIDRNQQGADPNKESQFFDREKFQKTNVEKPKEAERSKEPLKEGGIEQSKFLGNIEQTNRTPDKEALPDKDVAKEAEQQPSKDESPQQSQFFDNIEQSHDMPDTETRQIEKEPEQTEKGVEDVGRSRNHRLRSLMSPNSRAASLSSPRSARSFKIFLLYTIKQMNLMKKNNSEVAKTSSISPASSTVRLAQITIWGSLALGLTLPWLLVKVAAIIPLFDLSTAGGIGDTIGGITGPIFSFAGFILVFLTLHEQIKTSAQQDLRHQNSINEQKFQNIKFILRRLEDGARILDADIRQRNKENAPSLRRCIDTMTYNLRGFDEANESSTNLPEEMRSSIQADLGILFRVHYESIVKDLMIRIYKEWGPEKANNDIGFLTLSILVNDIKKRYSFDAND